MSKVETLDDYYSIGKASRTVKTNIGSRSYESGYNEFNFWDWKKEIYRAFSRTSFQKRFTGEGRDIMDLLKTDVEIGKMHRLMRHIDDENMILYSNHDKKAAVPANKELMLKILGGNEKRAREFLNKIIKLGIIQEVKFPNEGNPYFRYYVSPVFTISSTGISLRLYKLFREQLMPHLTDIAIKELETLLYYELHPEELAGLKEDYLKKVLSEDIFAHKSEVEQELIELRERITIWIVAEPQIRATVDTPKMNSCQLKLVENAFIEYSKDNDIELLMQNSDGLLLPND